MDKVITLLAPKKNLFIFKIVTIRVSEDAKFLPRRKQILGGD